MTKFILVRHGKPSYTEVENMGFKGMGVNLAPLNTFGINEVKQTAQDDIFKNSDILISSPYTRAIQTASIIGHTIGLDVNIEINLHEWLPDLTQNYNSKEEVVKNLLIATKEYEKKLKHPDFVYRTDIEPLESVQKRAFYVLKKYKNFHKVIVVSHSVLIKMITGEKLQTGKYVVITSEELNQKQLLR